MILTKEVKIQITNRNRKYYENIGYIMSQYIFVKISDLPISCHAKIEVMCELCGSKKVITYSKYWKNKNNNYYSCSNKCSISKNEKTCIEKYGKPHQNMNNHIRLKIIDTKIKKGIISYNYNDYLSYRRVVDNYTNHNKKELFDKWDGYDYYDGEFIKNNFTLNSNDNSYPSIDHKVSVLYGFNNNLTATEISSINNLCITKRINNSHKSYLNENNFIIKNLTK
jgi:hypothetical protein